MLGPPDTLVADPVPHVSWLVAALAPEELRSAKPRSRRSATQLWSHRGYSEVFFQLLKTLLNHRLTLVVVQQFQFRQRPIVAQQGKHFINRFRSTDLLVVDLILQSFRNARLHCLVVYGPPASSSLIVN